MVWAVPLWPFAFAVAFGSLFLLTGVLLQLLACLCAARRAFNREPPPRRSDGARA